VFWVLDRLYSDLIGVQGVYWISAALGITNGFIWQRLLVWRSSSSWRGEFARFLAVNIAISVTNSALLLVAVEVAGFPAFPSQLVITAFLVVGTFFLSRAWVFRKPSAES
jgi:putative flippase GtrA